MSSMLKCLLRVCFEDTPEESDDACSAPQSNLMSRQPTSILDPASSSSSIRESTAFRPADLGEDDDDEADDNHCCRTNDASEGTTSSAVTTPSRIMSDSNGSVPASWRQFWRTLREKLNFDATESSAATGSETRLRQRRDETIPILTQAFSFDSSKGVPTIQTEQIVMPGSELQLQMAKAMSATLEAHDDECVICMEGFCPDNPRMPTRCGCGENKTYFHLPCLYQWIDQSKDCPSCRKRLRWEEF